MLLVCARFVECRSRSPQLLEAFQTTIGTPVLSDTALICSDHQQIGPEAFACTQSEEERSFEEAITTAARIKLFPILSNQAASLRQCCGNGS